MTNKMTKKDYFNTLLTIADVKANASLVKFIENELDLLAKKNSGNRKPTAVQKANEEISEKILEVLDKPMTATDIMKAVQPLVDVELSNQKISALLRLLGEKGTGQVKKTVDKRKSYFERV
jgi:DNA-binding transcriptional regulator GbsR (MarR family)